MSKDGLPAGGADILDAAVRVVQIGRLKTVGNVERDKMIVIVMSRTRRMNLRAADDEDSFVAHSPDVVRRAMVCNGKDAVSGLSVLFDPLGSREGPVGRRRVCVQICLVPLSPQRERIHKAFFPLGGFTAVHLFSLSFRLR